MKEKKKKLRNLPSIPGEAFEEDTTNLSHTRSSRSKAKSNAKIMPTSQIDPESSSKKKSKKRKPHEDDSRRKEKKN
jgi:hypothetical protein